MPKALLVTRDGCSRLIDVPEPWPKLRVPFTRRMHEAFGPLGAAPLHPADPPTDETRTYELVDEVRSHAAGETYFVYTECRA